MDLIEASLLLDPGQDELRHDAVVVATELALSFGIFVIHDRPVEAYHRAANAYLRGLEDLEIFLREERDFSKYETTGQTDFLKRFIFAKD